MDFRFDSIPYIKLGGCIDTCCICERKLYEENLKQGKRLSDIDIKEQLRGKIESTFVFYLRKRSEDICICFDCFKEQAKMISNIEESFNKKEEVIKEKEEVVEEKVKTKEDKRKTKK